MSVEISKNKKTGVVICGGPCATGCGKKSKTYGVDYPIAPELDISEKSEKDGWTFNCDFFAMCMGHTNLCPTCSNKK